MKKVTRLAMVILLAMAALALIWLSCTSYKTELAIRFWAFRRGKTWTLRVVELTSAQGAVSIDVNHDTGGPDTEPGTKPYGCAYWRRGNPVHPSTSPYPISGYSLRGFGFGVLKFVTTDSTSITLWGPHVSLVLVTLGLMGLLVWRSRSIKSTGFSPLLIGSCSGT